MKVTMFKDQFSEFVKTGRKLQTVRPTLGDGVTRKHDRCATPFCRRRRGKKKRFCHTCHARKVRAANPFRAQWRRLKDKARQRGINFCLPFWYFEIFARDCQYVTNTGNGRQCLTVDRKNNLLGYVIGNIQALTREANRRKQFERDFKRYECGYAWRSGGGGDDTLVLAAL
jgi:hypothetical protein